jgi:ribokinase
VHLVTSWCATEADAFDEALALAAQHEVGGRPAPADDPSARARRASTDGPGRDLDVVVLGSAREDLVVRVPRLPAAGETLAGELLAREPGGKALRQAIAAARLGARVALVTRVGADRDGDEILARLRAEGIRTEHVARATDARTALGSSTRTGGEREHRDRFARRERRPVARGRTRERDAIQHAAVLLASLEAPAASIAEAFRIARRHDTHAVLDADPAGKVQGRCSVSRTWRSSRRSALVIGTSVTGRRSALGAARSLLRRVTEARSCSRRRALRSC